MLLPAMQAGARIVIPDDLTADTLFLDNLDTLQDIFVSWYPNLSKIDIDVQQISNALPATREGAAAFFSGGIDANYTLLTHEHELSQLVYVRGIDMQLDEDELWLDCLERNRQAAGMFGKTLVTIETNIRFFIKEISSPGIGWGVSQGCGLAAIAHAMNPGRILISSSNTYKALHPYGTHPLTDPLLSSSNLRIDHVGCEAKRHEKLMRISQAPKLLPLLRVCWQDKGFNCGHCDKCLHFRMALRLMNTEAGGLKPLSDFGSLKEAHTRTKGEYIEWKDNLLFAQKVGDRKAEKALIKILNRHKKRRLVKLIDEVYFRGWLKKIQKRMLGSDNLPKPRDLTN